MRSPMGTAYELKRQRRNGQDEQMALTLERKEMLGAGPYFRRISTLCSAAWPSQSCKRRSENRPRHAVRAGDAAEEK